MHIPAGYYAKSMDLNSTQTLSDGLEPLLRRILVNQIQLKQSKFEYSAANCTHQDITD
jgi:hypothetical protein